MTWQCSRTAVIGLKSKLLTQTKGTVILNHVFDSYKPAVAVGDTGNSHGSLIATEAGVSNGYGLNNAQERGTLFIGPAVEVYMGMIVGENAKDEDIEINVNKTKKLTNMRASGSDDAITLTPPKVMSLEESLEYLASDELLEVTPLSLRLRKKILDPTKRKRDNKDKANQ